MNWLICFVLMCAVLVADALDKEFIAEVKAEMKNKINKCAEQEKATSDDVAAIFSHKVPSSHEGKCIFFCMHKMFNAQNEDGSLNLPGALEAVDLIKDMDADLHKKLTQVFKGCENAPFDSDPCVYATNIVLCIVDSGKKMGLDELLIE